MTVARALALWALVAGCAPHPLPLGIGEAAPPGQNRNPHPLPTPAPEEPAPPPGHEPQEPLPDRLDLTVVGDDAGPAPADASTPNDPAPAASTTTAATTTTTALGPVWEDPSGTLGEALAAFRAHGRPLRVVQLGDSHTEGDAFTGPLRRRLWERLGDGGRGFVPVVGAQQDVVRMLRGPWRVVRSGLHTAGAPNGLGLARAIATLPDAMLHVATCTRCPGGRTADRITVLYRPREAGGSLRIAIDGHPPETVSTRTGGSFVRDVADGPHAVTVQPAGDGAVELYGVALDRAGDGARLDAAGVIGAQASHLRAEDWSVLGAQLAARAPTLVLLAFGTNEAFAPHRDAAEDAASFAALVQQVRAAVPDATVALLGAPDGERRTPGAAGIFAPPPRLSAVIDATRSTAAAEHALFVDLRSVMGGPGTIGAWTLERPPAAEPDHVHLTPRGYARLAARLVEGLLGPRPAP